MMPYDAQQFMALLTTYEIFSLWILHIGGVRQSGNRRQSDVYIERSNKWSEQDGILDYLNFPPY